MVRSNLSIHTVYRLLNDDPMVRTISYTLMLGMLLVHFALSGQTTGQVPRTNVVLEPSQGAWDARQLEESAAYWRSAIATGQAEEATMYYNLFRSERNLALQRNKGRLKGADVSRLQAIATDLRRSGQSPELDIVQFQLDMPTPSDRTMNTLALYADLQPTRTDLLAPLLVGAILAMDDEQCRVWTARIKTHDAIAQPLLDLADDMLLSVGPEAILFTAGEMDSHAIWVRQYADGKRPDVQVLDMRLLENDQYRAVQWGLHGDKGPVPRNADEFLLRFVDLRQERPVHLSLGLGSEQLAALRTKVFVSGLTVQYSTSPVENMKQLEHCWMQMRKPTSAGPLSRNYLVAGSVLLKHYRAIGDEAGTARMEHELRQLARQMNATDKLYRLGILEH